MWAKEFGPRSIVIYIILIYKFAHDKKFLFIYRKPFIISAQIKELIFEKKLMKLLMTKTQETTYD